MDVTALTEKRAQVQAEYDSLQIRIREENEESLKLMGEYRVLTKLIESLESEPQEGEIVTVKKTRKG